MPPPPEDFSGVWVRRGLVVGGIPVDDADVLWLQAGGWYADLRIPHDDRGGPVEAFAGPASWYAPHFTWDHLLDWVGTFPLDVGRLEPDGADLVESGTFDRDGTPAPYRERWIRSGPATPRLAAVHDGPDGRAALVRVHDHAIALANDRAGGGGFTARRDRRDPTGAWRTVFARGDQDDPPALPALDGARAGDTLAFGRFGLRVVEVKP
jgi:hypothetical protein